MNVLEASLSLRADIGDVFDLLTRAESIPLLVPPDLKLEVVEAPRRLEAGSRFQVRIDGFGPPQTVVYEIVDFAAPLGFTETQVKGPLKRYRHEHRLANAEHGTVLVSDRIEFEPPGGLLGFLVTAERLRKSLQSGLAFRHRRLRELLEAS
jgi:ligand-binding SRPBCC domain-containing protein